MAETRTRAAQPVRAREAPCPLRQDRVHTSHTLSGTTEPMRNGGGRRSLAVRRQDVSGLLLPRGQRHLRYRSHNRYSGWIMKPARGKWTTTSPTRGSLRAIEMLSADSPTSSPLTGTLPVSSGVMLICRPALRPLGSSASTLVAAGL